MKSRPRTILIAHQSTIPHYRVPFYNALARLKPQWWDFRVVYDGRAPLAMAYGTGNSGGFNFQIHPTWTLRTPRDWVRLQSFILSAGGYDLLVLENALNNLSYPLGDLWRWAGKKIVYWGHGRDLTVVKPRGLKRCLETFKYRLVNHSEGFLAYTETVRQQMIHNPRISLLEERIFNLNNTIDIERHHQAYLQVKGQHEHWQKRLGVAGGKVLVYVGRLNRGKRLDLLASAFSLLWEQDPTYRLIVIGPGNRSPFKEAAERCSPGCITFHNGLTEAEELAPYYAAGDLYVFPGDVGLGPLQALCYELPPVVIDNPTNKPEFEYLTERNAIILSHETEANGFARAIDRLLHNSNRLQALKYSAWHSIEHLTIENMAHSFISAIDSTFQMESDRGLRL